MQTVKGQEGQGFEFELHLPQSSQCGVKAFWLPKKSSCSGCQGYGCFGVVLRVLALRRGTLDMGKWR